MSCPLMAPLLPSATMIDWRAVNVAQSEHRCSVSALGLKMLCTVASIKSRKTNCLNTGCSLFL